MHSLLQGFSLLALISDPHIDSSVNNPGEQIQGLPNTERRASPNFFESWAGIQRHAGIPAKTRSRTNKKIDP